MFPSSDDRKAHQQNAIRFAQDYNRLIATISTPETLASAAIRFARNDYRRGRKNPDFMLRVPVANFDEWARTRRLTDSKLGSHDSLQIGNIIRREAAEHMRDAVGNAVFVTVYDIELKKEHYIFKGRIMIPA